MAANKNMPYCFNSLATCESRWMRGFFAYAERLGAGYFGLEILGHLPS